MYIYMYGLKKRNFHQNRKIGKICVINNFLFSSSLCNRDSKNEKERIINKIE